MSDEPEESGWQGFLRKAKYQMGSNRPKGDKYADQSWNEMMRQAFEDGFLGNYDDALVVFDVIVY